MMIELFRDFRGQVTAIRNGRSIREWTGAGDFVVTRGNLRIHATFF